MVTRGVPRVRTGEHLALETRENCAERRPVARCRRTNAFSSERGALFAFLAEPVACSIARQVCGVGKRSCRKTKLRSFVGLGLPRVAGDNVIQRTRAARTTRSREVPLTWSRDRFAAAGLISRPRFVAGLQTCAPFSGGPPTACQWHPESYRARSKAHLPLGTPRPNVRVTRPSRHHETSQPPAPQRHGITASPCRHPRHVPSPGPAPVQACHAHACNLPSPASVAVMHRYPGLDHR